jgi:hypothetical protein
MDKPTYNCGVPPRVKVVFHYLSTIVSLLYPLYISTINIDDGWEYPMIDGNTLAIKMSSIIHYHYTTIAMISPIKKWFQS